MKRVVVLVGLLAAAAGCVKTTGLEVSGALGAPSDGQSELSRAVIVNNARLGRTLQVVDVRHDIQNDLLKAGLTLASKYEGTLSFQYKFAWFDAAGMEIRADSEAWTPLVLHGYETRTVQGVAPHPSARAFKVKIRR